MMKMKVLTLILACLFLAVPCIANTIIVDPNGSADFVTIQDAIDNSSNGDTIEVRQGRFCLF